MTKYKTADELIAEIKSSLYFKDNPHLIDEASIYRWIFLALKTFGTSVMSNKSTMVKVENYKACLPEDFGQLSLAVWCEKERARIKKDGQRTIAKFIYSDQDKIKYMVNNSLSKDDFTDSCDNIIEENRITETIRIDSNIEVEQYYTNPQYVKIGRSTERGFCVDGCINRNIVNSPYSINIKGKMVYANFKEGNLYMEYYGLPSDEDGLPLIPETFNGYLEQYIENNIRLRLLEEAMMSKDATNLQNMFQYYVGKDKELRASALRDTSPLTLQSFWNYVGKKRMDAAKFDLHFGAREHLRHRINRG